MANREMHLVVGGRLPKIPIGVFSTRELAEAYCARHNAWYGADHPLSPLEVRPIEVDPQPLPLAEPQDEEPLRQLRRLAALGRPDRHVASAPASSEFGQVLHLRRP